MINYTSNFGVSEVARILKVERDIIKTWAYNFSSYLNPKANPPKGIPRQFTTSDIRIFAYVLMYWEENPDIEAINFGLNSNNHYECPFNEITIQATPLFIEPPENLGGNLINGIVFGGLSEFSDTFILADSYKLAGDKLVDVAIGNDNEYELFCPAIYNYRHATELYLKATLGLKIKSHNLLSLLQKFKAKLKTEFNNTLPELFENIIVVFNDFDPNGTTFRYGGSMQNDDFLIDLMHVKTLMGWLAESFQKIRELR